MAKSLPDPVEPHSVEAEQATLGALLLSEKAWSRVAPIVQAKDFFRADHRIIFAAIASLHDAGNAVDVMTVCDYLALQGSLDHVGGLAYLGRLSRDTPGDVNVESYATAVRERSGLRQLNAFGDELAKRVTESNCGTAAELAAEFQEKLQRLGSAARKGNGLVDARELIGDLVDDLDRRSGGPIGLRVGLPDFDDLTGGLEAGDLVVVAARPGMGKTALLVSVASAVSQSTGVAVFSAEMPSRQLMRRALALHGDIPQGLLRKVDNLTDAQWSAIDQAAGELAKRALWIDETASPTLSHIRAETIALKYRAPLGLVVIDYVQLVRAQGATRYEQLRDVAYGCKGLAKELGIPVIVLAQLNRDVEKRDHKRPSVSDLRDSGAIEEAADIVGLLYSESYYDPDFQMPNVLECRIAKNRNGERGDCLWCFEGAHSRITALDPDSVFQYRRIISKRRRSNSNDL